MKTIKDFNVANKKVLVRCDFNVPLDNNGKIENDFRIKQTIPTIEQLIKKKAKVILMSHLGRPESRESGLSLAPIQERLRKYLHLKVLKADDCIGRSVEKQIEKLEPGSVLLLENLRFHKEESINDLKFSKELAKLGDIYINDAFGVCHRKKSSVVGLPKLLPSGIGLLLQKELKILSRVTEDPWRPFVVVIGGAKIDSKVKVIKRFLDIADHLLIGGKIANAILTVKGMCIGRPWPEDKVAKDIGCFDLTSVKMHLPVDAAASPNVKGEFYVRESAPAKVRKDELLLDIGPETINIFSQIIKQAKMIVWVGPLGYFEEPAFAKGTKAIAESIIKNHKAFTIAGGGDTVSALFKLKLADKFDHLSTGGGAMLSFLSGEELAGLKVL